MNKSEKPNSLIRTSLLAFLCLAAVYGGLFAYSVGTADNVQTLARSTRMLAAGTIPAVFSIGGVLLLALRSRTRWSALRVWLVYSPFLLFSLCTGFFFAARFGGPYVSPEVYSNQKYCYSVSVPADAEVSETDPAHVSFQSSQWAGGVQFAPSRESLRVFAEGFAARMKSQDETLTIESGIEELSGGNMIRFRSQSLQTGVRVRTWSFFFRGQREDFVHMYALLPESPRSDAVHFTDQWPSSFVWTDDCRY